MPDAPTLKQLECLVSIEETKHFRRAAERLKMSQPALSAQIQNLEAGLGVNLVERNAKGVSLSPIGREIVLLARDSLNVAQAIRDVAESGKQALVGTIRLGVSATVGPYLLPLVVARLHKQHNRLRLHIREGAPRDLAFDLARGDNDLILSQLPEASPDFRTVPLYEEPLYLVMANDHRLASQETVRLTELAGEKILSLGPNYHLFEQIKRICQDVGATLLDDYEGTSLDALRQMAGMATGIALLPALYVHSEIGTRRDVIVKKLKGRRVVRSVGLVWRKSSQQDTAYLQLGDTICSVIGKKFNDVQLVYRAKSGRR